MVYVTMDARQMADWAAKELANGDDSHCGAEVELARGILALLGVDPQRRDYSVSAQPEPWCLAASLAPLLAVLTQNLEEQLEMHGYESESLTQAEIEELAEIFFDDQVGWKLLEAAAITAERFARCRRPRSQALTLSLDGEQPPLTPPF